VIGCAPKPGFVIRYLHDLSAPGEVSSPSNVKERPAVVIMAVTRQGDRTVVRVAPITHRWPGNGDRAMELPQQTKARLGLDGQRSWVILDHANEFVWPGPDVRPVPDRGPATIYFGPPPPAFYQALKLKLLNLQRVQRAQTRLRGQ